MKFLNALVLILSLSASAKASAGDYATQRSSSAQTAVIFIDGLYYVDYSPNPATTPVVRVTASLLADGTISAKGFDGVGNYFETKAVAPIKSFAQSN